MEGREMTITQNDPALELRNLREPQGADSTHSTGRRFGQLESYYSRRGLTVRCAALVDGRIDIELMTAAFDALADRNPVLRSIVRKDDDGYLLETRDSNTLPTFVSHGDPTVFVNLLSPPIDQTSHLAELAIVHGTDQAGVALTICHNIADMSALAAYFTELWQNYTELVTDGVIADREIRPIPNGPEHWLDPAQAPAMPAPLEGEFVQPASIVSGVASVRDRVQLEFSEATTSALRQVTKERGTTVHAAVTGAVLTAERSLIDQKGAVPMALRSSVDLRRRMEDVIQPLEATAFLGQVMTQLHVDSEELPLAMGMRVVESIRARIADGTAIYSSVQPTDAYRPQISYAVNGGTISDIPTPNDAAIKKIVLGISEHIEYRTLTYASWTFAGRLHIDVFVPRAAMSMASRMELADKIRNAIVSMAAGQRADRLTANDS
jgi:phenolphthiocerol/phthiocerol/phthiodiolone dimycocerosyl transferase